jgi:hypothetical protein
MNIPNKLILEERKLFGRIFLITVKSAPSHLSGKTKVGPPKPGLWLAEKAKLAINLSL